MENRRRFPRFDSTFQIRYLPEGKNISSGYTISSDVSGGGLRMPASSGIINKGDILKLDMESTDGTGYIFATGKVKWLKILDKNAPLDEEVGIEFTDIHSADVDKLLRNYR
jgi:hypothetical protein